MSKVLDSFLNGVTPQHQRTSSRSTSKDGYFPAIGQPSAFDKNRVRNSLLDIGPTPKNAFNPNKSPSFQNLYLQQQSTDKSTLREQLNAIKEEKAERNQDDEPISRRKMDMLKVQTNLRDLNTSNSNNSPLLFVPPALISAKSRHSTFKKPFLPFDELLSTHRKDVKNFDESLISPNTSKDQIIRQLAYNKNQERIIVESTTQSEKESHRMMAESFKTQKKKELKMPRIHTYPSRSHFYSNDKIGSMNDTKLTKIEPVEITNKVGLSSENTNGLFSRHLRFFKCKDIENFSYRPKAREGATFTIFGKYGYLYGGRSQRAVDEIEVLDLTTGAWKTPNAGGEVPVEGRIGHSACLYERNLVFFGGERRFNEALKLRECLNDIRMFVIDTQEWKWPQCFGEQVEPRRNHVAAVVGKHMLVYGGIDNYGNLLSDLKALNLVTMRWQTCSEEGNNGMGIAFHAACAVFHPERRKIMLHKIPELVNPNPPTIKEEGIYVFGGKSETGEILNTLKILKVGDKPAKWIVPETTGKPPLPRMQHTMDYYRKLNCLVVFGGRNEQQKFSCLNDFGVLWLETMTWMQVSCWGDEIISRYSHCAGIFGTKLYIFGGINYGSYVGSELELIELDQTNAMRMQRERNEESAQNQSQVLASRGGFVNARPLPKINRKDSFDLQGFISFLPKPTKEELRGPDFLHEEEEDETPNNKSPNKKKPELNSYKERVKAQQLMVMLSPKHVSPKAAKGGHVDSFSTAAVRKNVQVKFQSFDTPNP